MLHTHSRRLDYHPYVHLVMPAAAIDADKRLWCTQRGSKNPTGYLFNHKALAKVFRAKLLEGISQAAFDLPPRYPKKWVVDIKSVGSGDKALVYLGRYLYKGVIQEKDIVACRDGQVTFRYQDSKTRQMQTRTLPGAQFLWLILRHALPKGFRRAQLRLFVSQQQTADSTAASPARRESEPGAGLAEKTVTPHVPVLRGAS